MQLHLIFIRYKKYKTENFGNVMCTEGKKSMKKMPINQMRECYSMEVPLLMQLFKKALMRDMLISVECSEQEYISQNIVVRAISMSMELEEELDVLHIKIDLATYAIGINIT